MAATSVFNIAVYYIYSSNKNFKVILLPKINARNGITQIEVVRYGHGR